VAVQIEKAKRIAEELMKICHNHADGMDELVKDWNTDSKGLGLEISKVYRDFRDCFKVLIDCLDEKPKKGRKK